MILMTPFETSNMTRRTTRDEESIFLQQLEHNTDVELRTIGHSVRGNPIWEASIGSGSTIVVCANVHGNEPSGREACLTFLRDLALSTDPETVAYLENHKIVFIPTVNPDGTSPTQSRTNANDVDLNRDYISLRQPETRAVITSLNEHKPVMVFDMHEVGDDEGNILRPWWDAPPGAQPELLSLGEQFYQYTSTRLSEYGDTEPYPEQLIPWGSLSTIAPARHSVGYLFEVSWRLTTWSERHLICVESLHSLIDFHNEHTDELESARDLSSTSNPSESIRIPTHDRVYQGPTIEIPGDTEYEVNDNSPYPLLDLHEITYSDNTVTLNQPSKLLAAYVLDPQSTENIPTTETWSPAPAGEPIEPPGIPESTTPKMTVRKNNVLYPVQNVYVKSGSNIHPIKQAYVKRNNTTHRVQ